MDKTEELERLETGNTEEGQAIQSDAEEELARRVQWLFRQAWDAKQQLNLNQLWQKCDDYKHNRQNPKQSPDHPGSVTNVIHRVIENQISDLLDKPYSSTAKGQEPGDDMFAEQAQHIIDFILDRNKLEEKLNQSEHDRLELGTTVIKVWLDKDDLDGRGLPKFEIVSPTNFFPDPKVHSTQDLQKAEFVIHAVPKPLSWFRKTFERGKYVQREVAIPYDPQQVFTDDRADEVHVATSQKALLLECYMRDENGELFCLHVANHILLEDSREKMGGKKLQRRDLYPFVMINCYLRRGTVWGMGDVELLFPQIELINELDDAIRTNARLMGNPQIVVGMGAGKGFDFRKWTTSPGLRIPMRDHTAWKIVEPVPVSSDIPARREKAFQEIDLISGVQDVSRGEKPGQVTAASAIIALQQSGQKMVVHKNKMFTAGWSQVLTLLFDEVLEHWDEEMWIRINGDHPDWKFVNPADFRKVPMLIPNDLFGVIPGEDPIKRLTDDEGNEMTRDAQFDFTLNMGNGFPSDKTFIMQIMTELAKLSFPDGPTITRSELRRFLRENVGLDLDDEQEMQPEMTPALPQQISMPSGSPELPTTQPTPTLPPAPQVPPIPMGGM